MTVVIWHYSVFTYNIVCLVGVVLMCVVICTLCYLLSSYWRFFTSSLSVFPFLTFSLFLVSRLFIHFIQVVVICSAFKFTFGFTCGYLRILFFITVTVYDYSFFSTNYWVCDDHPYNLQCRWDFCQGVKKYLELYVNGVLGC